MDGRRKLTPTERAETLARLEARCADDDPISGDDVRDRLGFEVSQPDTPGEVARFGPPEVSRSRTPAWIDLGTRMEDPDDEAPEGIGWGGLYELIEQWRPAWQADALCLEYPDLPWFPERGESSRPAKDVCARCMAVDECLSYALAESIDQGIWGGTSARERKKLRREQSAA